MASIINVASALPTQKRRWQSKPQKRCVDDRGNLKGILKQLGRQDHIPLQYKSQPHNQHLGDFRWNITRNQVKIPHWTMPNVLDVYEHIINIHSGNIKRAVQCAPPWKKGVRRSKEANIQAMPITTPVLSNDESLQRVPAYLRLKYKK